MFSCLATRGSSAGSADIGDASVGGDVIVVVGRRGGEERGRRGRRQRRVRVLRVRRRGGGSCNSCNFLCGSHNNNSCQNNDAGSGNYPCNDKLVQVSIVIVNPCYSSNNC